MMPFTPFHLALPTFLLSLVVWVMSYERIWQNRYLWLAIFMGSIIPDFQGFMAVIFGVPWALHGFSHTLIGAFVYTMAGTLVILGIRYFDSKASGNYRTFISYVFIVLFVSIILLHLLPDALIYEDMLPYWPFSDVNYGNTIDALFMYDLFANAFVISILLLIANYFCRTCIGLAK